MTKKIVFVPGVWDLFHIGHVRFLERASMIASRLIVGVDTDESVRKTKGQDPVIPFEQRCEIIKACKFVDYLVSHENVVINPTQLYLNDIQILVLGGNWEGHQLPGLDVAKKNGIEVVYMPYTEGISTTEIKKRILEQNG